MLALPAFTSTPERDRVYHCDLFTLCAALEPASVDMILADLPYGTTDCPWDSVIPLGPMWAAFRRVIKPRGAIVLTAAQPFTSALVMSNPRQFRHEWVWNKVNLFTNYLNAKTRPLRQHEDALVFSVEPCAYYPQKRQGKPYKARRAGEIDHYQCKARLDGVNVDGMMYPGTVIDVAGRNPMEQGLHPTQKPVALFEYLIRTYTQAGDLVLDPVIGSGTTAIAARNTGRHFIGGDREGKYVEIARQRLAEPYTLPLLAVGD